MFYVLVGFSCCYWYERCMFYNMCYKCVVNLKGFLKISVCFVFFEYKD